MGVGTGLGLNISRKVNGRYGGELAYVREVNTCFSMTFPKTEVLSKTQKSLWLLKESYLQNFQLIFQSLLVPPDRLSSLSFL